MRENIIRQNFDISEVALDILGLGIVKAKEGIRMIEFKGEYWPVGGLGLHDPNGLFIIRYGKNSKEMGNVGICVDMRKPIDLEKLAKDLAETLTMEFNRNKKELEDNGKTNIFGFSRWKARRAKKGL